MCFVPSIRHMSSQTKILSTLKCLKCMFIHHLCKFEMFKIINVFSSHYCFLNLKTRIYIYNLYFNLQGESPVSSTISPSSVFAISLTPSWRKQSFLQKKRYYNERGKAGGHEPPLFPLPYHILAFFSSGISPSVPPHLTLPGKTTFLNGINIPLKCNFKKFSHVTQYIYI